jgi:hypothetical protein
VRPQRHEMKSAATCVGIVSNPQGALPQCAQTAGEADPALSPFTTAGVIDELERIAANIYDDPRFFAGYSSLERFVAGWDLAREQSILVRLLPLAPGGGYLIGVWAASSRFVSPRGAPRGHRRIDLRAGRRALGLKLSDAGSIRSALE